LSGGDGSATGVAMARRNREPADAPAWGSSEWLASLTQLSGAVGTAAFEESLFAALNRVVAVDHCTVFTFHRRLGRGHLLTTGRIDPETSLRLAEDYVGRYYADDPNFDRIRASSPPGSVAMVGFEPRSLSPEYRERFFLETDLVDKVSALTWQTDGVVYCNFYRLGDTGRFSSRESSRLAEVLPLFAQMITLHHRATPLLGASDKRADDPEEEIRRLAALLGPPLDGLTARERDVCLRVLLGYGSEAIALHLDIAVSSVVTYRKRAYEKLRISSQNELFALFLRSLKTFAI
jgi:DNA-binding CsgD family transcriptional regulator